MRNTKNHKKKTWREKRDAVHEGYPKITDIPDQWAKTAGHGKMVVLTAKLVDDFIQTIPKGKLATINLIRDKFAGDFGVDMTCPLTTGIFVWICAGAAEEDRASGIKNVSPYWRVLKEGGKLNPKYPGGVRAQAALLETEGFKIEKAVKAGSWKVIDYQKHLMHYD